MKIKVKKRTINVWRKPLFDRKDNFPAALLNCNDKNPKGPTVPAIAATTESPSIISPSIPSTNFLGINGINKVLGRRGNPFCASKEKEIVTVDATSAQARKPQCKKLTAKDESIDCSDPPLIFEK